MTVFIAHAPADRAVAENLEAFIERRGQFVGLDDGQTAQRPVQFSDVLVLLVSRDFVFAPARLRLERRALDAWAEGRLVVVKLDHAIAPVGLRDLPAIDASFEAQREFTWNKVADVVRQTLQASLRARTRASSDDEAGARSPEAPPAPVQSRARGIGRAFLLLLMTLPGLGALAAIAAVWLASGAANWAELRAGFDALGVRAGLPVGVTEWVLLGAIGLTAAVLLLAIGALLSGMRGRRSGAAPESDEPAAVPQSDAVFVSYARANSDAVLPVIEAVKREGRQFWIDQQGIGAGEGWAGEIVRAIRGAAGVIVMCSRAAFESDHVKREIYLADRYGKRLVPIFIEQAEPPEDFEYFFAGVQTLNLFETPADERPQALMQALAAA